jgi:hypothetical protein
MTSITRSLFAAAVLTFVAGPAFAECDMVEFPEMHVDKSASTEELQKDAAKIMSANKELQTYNACIDKMMKNKPGKDASKEDVAAWNAEVTKHTDAYNKALDNLSKAAAEYNEVAKAHKAASKG